MQPESNMPPIKQPVIRFMADVNQQSVHALISVVEAKLREGIRSIRLIISSPGGSVVHGISAYNFLKGAGIDLETCNFGTVDSIATVIYCAGAKRTCVPNARFLIHSVAWGTNGPARFEEKQMEELIGGLRIDRENIAKIIAENCRQTPTEVESAMLKGTTLSAEQAKEFGLVTEISADLIPLGAEVIGIG